MHKDLKLWLEKVWNERKAVFKGFTKGTGRAIHAEPLDKHNGVYRVYEMYSKGASGGRARKGTGTVDVPAFLKRLADYVETKRADCVIQDRTMVPFSAEEIRTLANGGSYLCPLPEPDKSGATEYLISLESFRLDFLHIAHPLNSSKPMDQRIYLNLAANNRAANFAAIVDAVYNHAGFRSAKVSSPNGPPRNDTALLYVADETAVEFALGEIRTLQQLMPAAFLPGLPRLTAAVSGLTGVGRGMEPPEYAVIRQGGQYFKKESSMSFGWWRACLIFMALDRTKWKRDSQSNAQRCEAFKRRAAKYFRAAGIDPDNPSVQVNPDSLPDYSG